MNYLAHAYFSGGDDGLIIGNFIADHVRGNDYKKFDPSIVSGILLHRQIDAFTDAHPAFRQAKRLFYQGFEKHSGILVDIYFDHLLARDFSALTGKNLGEFCENVYSVYRDHADKLPVSGNRFLQYVLRNNVYASYATIGGIETVLNHLSQRISHGVMLHESVPLFKNADKEITALFEDFFAEARAHFLPH